MRERVQEWTAGAARSRDRAALAFAWSLALAHGANGSLLAASQSPATPTAPQAPVVSPPPREETPPEPTPDPEAERAFAEVIRANRARAPFSVEARVTVEAKGEGQAGRSEPVEAMLWFDPTSSPRRAVLEMRGYKVFVHKGRVDVIHASNDRDYVSIEDDGSPYYTLLTSFIDLPFPQLGLVLGDEAPEDVLPQLCSRAGWIVPTRVEMIEVSAPRAGAAPAAADGAAAPEPGPAAVPSDGEAAPGATPSSPASPASPTAPAAPASPTATASSASPPATPRMVRRLQLTSAFEHLELDVDPATSAVSAMRLRLTGGPMVATGASLDLDLDCVDAPIPADEVEGIFAFDAGERRRIDLIAALPRAQERRGGGGGGGGGAAAAPLVGTRAPDLSLMRSDDREFDLANHRGKKVVVLDFWATWCGPCRVGLPMLDSVARRLAAKGVPVEIVAVNTLEGLEGEELRTRIDEFWRDKGFSLVLAIDEKGEAADAYGVRALPTTVVIGLDGLVHWQHTGLSERWAEELEAAVEAARKPFGAERKQDADAGGEVPPGEL